MAQQDAIKRIIADNGKRQTIAIVVTDSEGNEVAWWALNKEDWEARDYLAIARGKAQVAARTGVDSGAIAAHAPQYFRPGDPPFRGAKVFDGYIVAASGIQAELDEIIANLVGTTIQAYIWGAYFKAVTDDPDFIPADEISGTDNKPDATQP